MPRLARAVAAATLLVAAACGDGGDGDDELLRMPAGDAPIEPGRYAIPASAWSVADLEITFPEGWSVQYGHVYGTNPNQSDELAVYPVVVRSLFDDACHGEEVATEIGPSVDDLVGALRAQAGGADVSEPVETSLGGLPATRIDLRVPPEADLSECRLAADGVDGLQVWYSTPADKYFVLLPGATASVYVLDVEGERQVFLAQVGDPATDADRAELDAVLDSIRIDAG